MTSNNRTATCFLSAAVITVTLLAGCKEKPQPEEATPTPPSATAESIQPAKTPSLKAAQSNEPRISKGCTMADTDENGQTSEEEAAARYKSKLEENRTKIQEHNLTMMRLYDTNGNGTLEDDELTEYRNYRAKLMGK